MNNRWGKPIQSKASLRTPGQSNINININFNALKEKPNMFGGKKIDNFIQVSNEPKSNISRPNVSMETLKHKKKPFMSKEDQPQQQSLNRKKSKSKIIHEVCTPEKIKRIRDVDNSKSVDKKSTKKRSSKSYENLKHFYQRSSPRQSNKEQIQTSQENSRPNSRSRSKSQSNKKLYKNSSISKINTIGGTKTKNTTHNSKKEDDKQKKVKKPQTIKLEKTSQKQEPQPITIRKPSITKVKPKSEPKNKKPQKLPLPLPQESEDEAEQVVNQKGSSFDDNKTNKKIAIQKKDWSYAQQIKKTHNQEDLKSICNSICKIQKNIRAFRARTDFINELDAMNHEIEKKKYHILNQDANFWDDAKSDSILRADDQQTNKEISQHGNLDLEKSISSQHRNNFLENSSVEQASRISKSRILQANQIQMMQRIAKLEDNLKMQQAKTEQLQLENKELKVSLQKVSVNSGSNSNQNSMQSSFRPHRSSPKVTHESDPFLEEQTFEKRGNRRFQESRQSDQQNIIDLVLPIKKIKKTQKLESENCPEIEPLFRGGAKKPQFESNFECTSPRSIHISIDKNLSDLLNRKQNKLQENYKKEVEILKGRIYSPKTYSTKFHELNQYFKKQKDECRDKMHKAAFIIKQIAENQLSAGLERELQENRIDMQKKSSSPKGQKVLEFNNVNLNSHRSRQSSEENEAFQSSQESENSIVHKNNRQQLVSQIQSRNNDAIRIFDEIQRQHESEEGHFQEEIKRQHENSQANLEEQDSNFEQVGINKESTGPKGLETALLFIKEYCMSFIEFIRNSEVHKNTFIENICTPIEYDSFQFLKSYRTTLEDSNDASYYSLENQYIYPFFKLIFSKAQVITREAFNDFNEVYEKFQGVCHFPIERQFFLNSILDAFNQSLDYKRPCSIYGEPPAWISQSRALKNFDLLNQSMVSRQNFSHSQKFDQICGISIARVIEWSTCLCGFIPESPQIQNVVVDEEQINHIRETRIALMLEKDLLEGEEAMIDFGMEQTEVRMQLGVILTDVLVEEFLVQFQLFRN